MSILSQFLTKGDTILVISPSGLVNENAVREACAFIEDKGFRVIIGQNTFNSYFKFAGTHEERLADLQWAFDHPTAKAIFCARGGYGITYLIDQLDLGKFNQMPKWLIGYSDITALHFLLHKHNYCSIHGSVLQSLLQQGDSIPLLAFLEGVKPSITIPPSENNKLGIAAGEIIGGNLSMVINQLGTQSEPDFVGKILFLEEVGEYLYHIDRMLQQLNRAGKISQLAGLIIGDFSDLKESKEIFGEDVEELICRHCLEYEFPIAFDFPVGHTKRNWPIIHGAKVDFSVSLKGVNLNY